MNNSEEPYNHSLIKAASGFQPLSCCVQVVHPLIRIWPLLSILSAFVGFFLGVLTQVLAIALFLAVLGLIVTPVIIFTRFPTKDWVTLNEDNMSFQNRDSVLFKDLESYQTDYLMKIKVKGEKFSRTLGGCAFRNPEEGEVTFDVWRAAFDKQIYQWKRNQLENGENREQSENSFRDDKLPKRTFFFGSTGARLMGATFIILAIFAFCLFCATGFPPNVLGLGISSLIIGGFLLIKLN